MGGADCSGAAGPGGAQVELKREEYPLTPAGMSPPPLVTPG